jgi:hypothetical protein
MDTQKIIANFETRKRVTGKALDDLFSIMKWITETVDDINISTEKEITMRASEMNDGNMKYYGTHPDDATTFSIRIIRGKCHIYYNCGYGYNDECWFAKSDIDYINLAEAIVAMTALITKLETIETRENSSGEISRIASLIAKK